MKKSTLLLMLMQAIAVSMYAQTTNYGTGSGTVGFESSYFGYWAGNLGQGQNNSFFGHLSGHKSTGGHNAAFGSSALGYNMAGSWNSALGAFALLSNTSGVSNTAIGFSALYGNSVGYENTATGGYALATNETGYHNTANGYSSLSHNNEGYGNVAMGYTALYANTSGYYNTGSGARVLENNTTGAYNSAMGVSAMASNSSGHLNSAFGPFALAGNSTGSLNNAFGYAAGPAYTAATSGLRNTTALGSSARPTASNQVRIGNTSVVSIGGQVSWSTLSDGRFKKDLKEDVAGLEFINRLRPVSYSVDKVAMDKFLGIPDSIRQLFSKSEINARQNGFVAQEVEEVIKKEGYVFHGIEAPQNENDHYGIRYAEFVVPLVKAVQELTAKIDMQEKFAQEQKKEMDVLKQQLKLSGTSTVDEYNSKSEVALYQNHPNPFSLDTEISMSLPESTGQATLIVYNMEGKQLKAIPIRERGKATAKIQANELKPGMYIYTLIVDSKVIDTKRMILTGY
jgi:hypothetical protein